MRSFATADSVFHCVPSLLKESIFVSALAQSAAVRYTKQLKR